MAMTEAQFLDRLLNPPKRKSNSTVTMQRSSGGQFEGRAGSIVRNNKGGRKRLPNGRRVFIPTLEAWRKVGLAKY